MYQQPRRDLSHKVLMSIVPVVSVFQTAVSSLLLQKQLRALQLSQYNLPIKVYKRKCNVNKLYRIKIGAKLTLYYTKFAAEINYVISNYWCNKLLFKPSDFLTEDQKKNIL